MIVTAVVQVVVASDALIQCHLTTDASPAKLAAGLTTGHNNCMELPVQTLFQGCILKTCDQRKELFALSDHGASASIWIDGDKFTMRQQIHYRHCPRE